MLSVRMAPGAVVVRRSPVGLERGFEAVVGYLRITAVGADAKKRSFPGATSRLCAFAVEVDLLRRAWPARAICLAGDGFVMRVFVCYTGSVEVPGATQDGLSGQKVRLVEIDS